ncbi:MAG: hypothetical protein QN178_01945 [Armatimonadota bacterium]|nr:hypothetical protein [Armatimonadota bacterium]
MSRWTFALRPPAGRASYLGVARDLTLPTPPIPVVAGLVTRPATPADFPAMVAFTQAPDFKGNRLKMADLERRYHRGDVCFMVSHHGEIATLGWTRFDNAGYLAAGIDIPLRANEAYVGAIFTRAMVRGRGLVTTGSLEHLRWLKERGVTKAYGWVRSANLPMLRTTKRLGWHATSHVEQYFLWFGVRIPIANIVTVADTSDPLAQWCGRERIRFRSGLRVFRQGPVDVPAGRKRSPRTTIETE